MIMTEDIAISGSVPKETKMPYEDASLVPIPMGINVSAPIKTPIPAATIVSNAVV